MTAATAALVTGDVQADFERDGGVCLRRAFDPSWIAELDRGMDAVLARPVGHLAPRPHDKPDRFEIHQFRWRDVAEFGRFVRESPAAAIAGALMRARKVNFLEDASFMAGAGADGTTGWHQDLPYYNVAGKMISIWMPLQPLTSDDGLRLVAGSHRWGRLFSPFAERENREGFEPVPDLDGERVLSWDLEPGDCVAFSALTLHAVLPTAGTRGSRRFSTRWAGDAVFYARGGVCSRRTEENGLSDGDPLDGDWYPVLWRRGR
jgi:hypothetical protein